MKDARFIKNLSEVILDNIDEGIHVVDKHGKTIIYNSKMASLEGLRREQVISRNLLEVFPSLTRETSTLLKVLKTGKPIIGQRQTYLNIRGEKISTINSTIPIIIDGEIEGALEISKDITSVKELSERIIDLQQEIFQKRERNYSEATASYTFLDIIGESREINEAITIAKKASRTSSNILIYGETGTGKELFAQSIHNEGNRRSKPFIAQNCAALPESLLEGILFGTVKGGFTGATDRPGLFEQADGGTLLLDEINSMGMGLQAKLLRVLQEGFIRRVGDVREIRVDVRIIATTNMDPLEAVEKGHLRSDLYYRLNVVLLKIPPLRERKGDIVALTDHFIDMYNSKFNKKVKGISKEVKDIFILHSWPGNVRELQNVIESAMNMVTESDIIEVSHLPQYLRKKDARVMEKIPAGIDTIDDIVSLADTIESIECGIIARALQESRGNISRAAERLNITRQALQYKIKKYGLNRKDYSARREFYGH